MRSLVTAAALVAVAMPGVALAERVLVADEDPELASAMTTTLAPWQLEIVVQPPAPESTRAAEERAIAGQARFVIWRRGGDIVVYDHERGAAEFRDAPAGPLDPASAMAAALSVKTLMRLPAPGTADLSTLPGRFRIQANVGGRAVGDGGLRAGAAVFVRPLAAHSWRLGLALEIGPGSDVDAMSFEGTYRDASFTLIASATWPLGPVDLEPFAGVGIVSTGLMGKEGSMTFDETETLPLVRAGLMGRHRFGGVSVGAAVAGDGVFGTPTYMRRNGNGVVFEVPSFVLTVGAFAAFDFDL